MNPVQNRCRSIMSQPLVLFWVLNHVRYQVFLRFQDFKVLLNQRLLYL